MDGHYFLLVIVTSTPSARARRDLIRSTWGDANNTDITVRWKLVFNLGQSSSNEINSQVVTEASLFNDVFMGEFTDTYMNLVLKVFAAFSWANKIDCDYILKADEDVYINLPQLVTWLKRPGVPDSLYGGALAKNTGVYRYPWHKHFISYKTYKSDKLHTYCRGPFYILSHNVLSSIIQREVFRDVFPIEDAYVGLLVKRLGVEPLQLPGCVWERERNLGTVLCDLLSFVCFGDSLSAANINHIHKKYLELEKINRTVAMKICHLNQL
ncbi:predicted protein [Nematostella vectensis]|uniref:Hexosyltransferase n=2 Tax=Nematostella vectensis TaxID=45351 RepID=A7RJH0_NEMVE|nr:predicted protein [Nematostella vectensis]|eukprot:XP_001640325.1 predicted protein [Nematostella vectensis]